MENIGRPSTSKATSDENSHDSSLLQELNEAKVRVSQMEKAARWWSDCTATWREKWGKVRAQRNKLRDELKALKAQNEKLLLEYKQLITDNKFLQAEVSKIVIAKRTAIVEPMNESKFRTSNLSASSHSQEASTNSSLVVSLENSPSVQAMSDLIPIANSPPERCLSRMPPIIRNPSHAALDRNVLEQLLQDEFAMLKKECHVPEPSTELLDLNSLLTEASEEDCLDTAHISRSRTSTATPKGNASLQIISNKLNHAKTYIRRCEEFVGQKLSEIAALQMEIKAFHKSTDVKGKFAIDAFHANVEIDHETSKDNSTCSPSKEKDIQELRSEIERLQQDNCNEWTRREQCESEKQSLQRDFKRQKQEIEDLKSDVQRLTEQASSAQSLGMKLLQEEIELKTRVSAEMKSANNKLRKQLQEKNEEISHVKVRTEQYETETKKLRKRVDELKRQLLTTEENVDRLNNGVKKMQRTVEDLTHQNEALQAQLKYASSRLQKQLSNNGGNECDQE